MMAAATSQPQCRFLAPLETLLWPPSPSIWRKKEGWERVWGAEFHWGCPLVQERTQRRRKEEQNPWVCSETHVSPSMLGTALPIKELAPGKHPAFPHYLCHSIKSLGTWIYNSLSLRSPLEGQVWSPRPGGLACPPLPSLLPRGGHFPS